MKKPYIPDTCVLGAKLFMCHRRVQDEVKTVWRERDASNHIEEISVNQRKMTRIRALPPKFDPSLPAVHKKDERKSVLYETLGRRSPIYLQVSFVTV